MINASKLVKDILGGNLSVHELIRDVETLSQFSSGSVNLNLIVNIILSMGCKLSLQDDRVITVPVDVKENVQLPDFLQLRHPYIHNIVREPFSFLKSYHTVFSRMEIMIYGKEAYPTTAVPFREVLDLRTLVENPQKRNVPSKMIFIPVLCLKTGDIKLVRISLRTLLQTPQNILNADVCIMRGKGPRRKIDAATVNVAHNCNEAEALERASAELKTLESLYSIPNVFTLEQATLLRPLLDTRSRDAEAIQQAFGSVHMPAPDVATA